jgi:lipid A ethanolaminephosphotransferase
MSLKLFRSTGYSSILTAGETRVAVHPGWIILFTSLWAGFASNQALWRELAAPGGAGMGQALMTGAFVAAAGAVPLSLLGWHKTLKPAAILVLFLAALAASLPSGQAMPMDGLGLSSRILPSWTGLLRWQAWAGLAVLAVLPAVCVCRTRVRRLSGGDQLSVNMTGVMVAGAVLALTGFLLFSGFI